MVNPLLETKNLHVGIHTPHGTMVLIHGVNISIRRGEIFALVGESGSGKTTLANAFTKLFPPHSSFEISGEVCFANKNLVQLDNHVLRQIRGRHIRYIFQEPSHSLNPILRIKTQFVDAVRNVEPMDAKTAAGKARRGLVKVGIENPDDVLTSYPHELSGGTLQRVLIAMALSSEPELIIADEPTSSVDSPLQIQLLDLLLAARNTSNSSVLLITHDLDIAHRYADTVAVMYAGRIIEEAPKQLFFDSPLHPYSQILCGNTQTTGSSFDEFEAIQKNPSHPLDPQTGCAFHLLCYKSREDCRLVEPALVTIDAERKVRCPYWK